jgi:pimeloyl-ACP methyl ester carboxylesterase
MAEMERWVRHAHPDWPEAGIRGTLANYEVRDDGTIAPWLAYDRHMQILRHLWEFRAAERVPLLSVPALFVLARREGPVRREEAEAVLSTLPAARSVWLDGDHDLHAQYPERVAELLAEAFG